MKKSAIPVVGRMDNDLSCRTDRPLGRISQRNQDDEPDGDRGERHVVRRTGRRRDGSLPREAGVRTVKPRAIASAVFAVLAWALPAEELLTSDPARLPEFEHRFGIAEQGFDSTLIRNPVRVDKLVEGFSENGDRRLLTITDMHALYPVPLESVVRVLTSYGSFYMFYRRLVRSTDLTPENGPFDYHRLRNVSRAGALGIEREYDYTIRIFTELTQLGAFRQKWRLETSNDGRLYAAYGSWYLEEVELEGKGYTYLRYFNATGFIEVPVGLETIMNTFMEADIKKVFRETVDAAQALEANR